MFSVVSVGLSFCQSVLTSPNLFTWHPSHNTWSPLPNWKARVWPSTESKKIGKYSVVGLPVTIDEISSTTISEKRLSFS